MGNAEGFTPAAISLLPFSMALKVKWDEDVPTSQTTLGIYLEREGSLQLDLLALEESILAAGPQ